MNHETVVVVEVEAFSVPIGAVACIPLFKRFSRPFHRRRVVRFTHNKQRSLNHGGEKEPVGGKGFKLSGCLQRFGNIALYALVQRAVQRFRRADDAMRQESRVNERLSVPFREIHEIPGRGICRGIHALRCKRAVPRLQRRLFAGQPFQFQPRRHARQRSSEGLQMRVRYPVRLFNRQHLMQPALCQAGEDRVRDFQHQVEPVFSYQRNIPFTQRFIKVFIFPVRSFFIAGTESCSFCFFSADI